MQKLGWPWTNNVTALGLVMAITACDSKSGSNAPSDEPPSGGYPSVGGASQGGNVSKSLGGSSSILSSLGGKSSAGSAGNGNENAASGAPPSSVSGHAGDRAASGGNSAAAGGTRATGGREATAGALGVCTNNADCSTTASANRNWLCSVPTSECVECLAAADCAQGAAGAAGAPNTSNLGCVKNKCVKYSPCVNSLGCQTGEVCSSSLGRCVQCVADADCSNGAHCGQNQCRINCVSDKDCTGLGLLCNASAGYCVSCNANADCPANRYCSGGECLRDVCVPGATRCQGNSISTCLADGSAWGSAVACASSRTCSTTATGAVCQPWACTPSTTACATTGEKVVSCSADGLTATTVNDCGAKSQVCVSGACAAVVCTAGMRFCQANAVRTCSAKGDTSSTYSTCSSSQYCDAATTSCKAMACTPNQPACNGNIATTCDAVGAGYAPGGTDCTAGSSGQVCSAGTCQSQLCTPSSYYCDTASAPNAIRLCASNGLTSSIYSTCSSGYYCDSSASSPTCRARVCTPGIAGCSTSYIASTCNSLGSGWVAGGTDCSLTNQVCSTGTCQDLVCSPNNYYCDPTSPNTLRYCESSGMTSYVASSCTSTTYCDAASASCKALVCEPNKPACTPNNVATTCNAQGSGYVTGGTDCTGTALPNCVLGACMNAVIDSIDPSPSTESTYSTGMSYTKVNFYTATSNRSLAQIEAYLNPGATTTLTWGVYEASTQTGSYSQIWTGTSSAASGAGYKSSGPIATPVALRAGYYYGIAVSWATPSSTLVFYYRSAPTFPVTVSFGTLTSANPTASAAVSYYASPTLYYPQRLTTIPTASP